jgi:hypothetical protein
MQIERDGNEATVKRDAATLDKLLADDWIGQSPAGTETKAQALADLKSEDTPGSDHGKLAARSKAT